MRIVVVTNTSLNIMPWWWLDHWETIEKGIRREIKEETWCDCFIKWPICTRTRLHKNWIYYFFIWIACDINLNDFTSSDEGETYHFVSKGDLLQNDKNTHRLEYIKENYDNILKEYKKHINSNE